MAIGNGLNLNEMLQSFMRVAIARLDLSSAHLFLFANEKQEPIHFSEKPVAGQLSHYMSIPVQYLGVSWAKNEGLHQVVCDHLQSNSFSSVAYFNEKVYQSFCIPEQGVIVFESVIEIEPSIKKSLEPIFKKIALSCYACLVHESLVAEIGARKNAENTIAHQASHDELTQLFNRRALTENLKNAIDSCEKNKKFGALIFIDLNQFKSINDVMGHDVGDLILKEVAYRLKGVARGKDTVARFGGDEFIILLPDLGGCEQVAEQLVNKTTIRILDVIEEPLMVDDLIYNVSCSMGFDIFSGLVSFSNVIKNADLAMYEAKALRQKIAVRYDSSMSEKVNIRSAYISELKNALKNNEFSLCYQPQYDVSHNIIGAEVLLRWNNLKHINESPDVYIPIAEDSELILAIGDWVFYESCRQLKILQDFGLPNSFKKLSINVSARQLGQENFFDTICRAIEASGVNPRQITIEITENILINRIHDVITLISKLNNIGVDCAIDDFGTGYSSLTYLRRLPSSLIKMDRSFVRDIHKDAENRSIAKMIIALGENLEMDILAEGVESAEELQCLKDLGCYQYQGFYFSHPLSFDQFRTLMQQSCLPDS